MAQFRAGTGPHRQLDFYENCLSPVVDKERATTGPLTGRAVLEHKSRNRWAKMGPITGHYWPIGGPRSSRKQIQISSGHELTNNGPNMAQHWTGIVQCKESRAY